MTEKKTSFSFFESDTSSLPFRAVQNFARTRILVNNSTEASSGKPNLAHQPVLCAWRLMMSARSRLASCATSGIAISLSEEIFHFNTLSNGAFVYLTAVTDIS